MVPCAGLIGLRRLLLLLLVLWWPLHGGVAAWKVDEFHKCHNGAFCKEARERAPGSSGLVVQDVSLSKGRLRAKLVPEVGGDALVLKISAYRDGIVRWRVQEERVPSGKRRFEVPDVLEPNLEDRRLWLQRVTEKDGASVVYLSGGLEIVLQHRPFQLHIRQGGKNVVSVNSKGLFHFDHLRERKEGEDWEETFRSHKDSRPHGPQSVSFDVSFHGAEHVYGIPEHATSFALKPTRGPGIQSEPYRLFNLDVFEYIHDSPFGLYGAVPFMLSHSHERTTGFFWLNAAEMLIDVMAPGWVEASLQEVVANQEGSKVQSGAESDSGGVDTLWTAESGMLDAFIFVGPGPKDVVKQYTSVTGTTRLPQLFAIAYHQCRWNYKDDVDVAEVDAKFDEHNIPYDVLWLDIEHTDGKRYFTWDSVLFPDPKEMQRKIAAKGRRMVTIVDPHIKRDDGFALHKEATQKGYYVKDKHGNDYDGWCWPGSSSYLDMLDPEIRSWWADKFSYSNYVGSTSTLYTWNDMNEPSVFNGPEATMPRDNIHYGDVEHRDVHNAYGYYFHMASADGLVKRNEGKDRPFVLSRAFFAGTQKVGPVWTGDNTGDWDHLRVSVPMILSLGVTGIAFTGADVGGFFGNPEPELLARFYQLGAFYPFFRGHAHLDTKRREPWLFGEPYTSVIREAIRTRYALLPYYYTLFKEASESGVPVVRPLWMEFPKDERSFDIDDEFLVGNSLLVHGVYSKGATSETVYLPGSEPWYHYKTGTVYAGGRDHSVPISLDDIPVFQHGGTIIPRKDRVRRSSSQMENDPYTFVVALNSSSKAQGKLYIDDGKSYEFKEGAFIHRTLSFSDGRLCSSKLSTSTSIGAQVVSTPSVVERIIIYGLIPRDWKKDHRAIIEKTSREVCIEVAPPLLRRGQAAKSAAVIVRAPNLPISEDWCLQIL